MSTMPSNLGNDLETDPRFPSGTWVGFYLQKSHSPDRQPMDLSLTFALGKIYGSGTDPLGDFTLNGRYDTANGKVTLHKQYLGEHLVLYEGWAEPGKGIWGVWRIGDTKKDGFHIWSRDGAPAVSAKPVA